LKRGFEMVVSSEKVYVRQTRVVHGNVTERIDLTGNYCAKGEHDFYLVGVGLPLVEGNMQYVKLDQESRVKWQEWLNWSPKSLKS
jgi:hypothetical protein